MFSIRLKITGNNPTNEVFFEYLEYYLSALYGSRQIFYKVWDFEPLEGGVAVMLTCYEQDAYLADNSTIYANRARQKIESELGFNFDFIDCGIHPELGEAEVAQDSKSLFLNGEYGSPINELETLKPLPFYKLPDTYHDGEGYYDINSWVRNYRRVLGLWHSGKVGPSWAQKQLQNYGSALSKEGIACCRRIEELTGIPTYYFLFNNRSISKKKDENRKCPNCGGNWLLEDAGPEIDFPFQCDPCRLVSERTKNS